MSEQNSVDDLINCRAECLYETEESYEVKGPTCAKCWVEKKYLEKHERVGRDVVFTAPRWLVDLKELSLAK